MLPKSHTLFHFTKNIEFLKDILVSGFWPRYCLEDSSWYGGKDFNTAYPMVCFCDIPLSRVGEHVEFYGNFGIGVTREWANSNGLSPVLYLNHNTPMHKSLSSLFLGNKSVGGYYPYSNSDVNIVMAHIKPVQGLMRIGSDVVDKDFYQENEWRAVPNDPDSSEILPWASENQYLDSDFMHEANEKTKKHKSLKIAPTDIKYIFVNSDSDISNMVKFIQDKLDYYPNALLNVLLSRIVSLETIRRDI
ncbi:hypothetical protein A1OQ_22070 [Enterovibrio norvegicus FF-162]|nr:hypothetical protein A1OQ_22070 [Enterovibrio norvegicus FF-162]